MQDIATLGVVNVRYCGYIAVVKVEVRENIKVGPPSQSLELLDQPDGGACALNINRLVHTSAEYKKFTTYPDHVFRILEVFAFHANINGDITFRL